jgi:Helicase HerA, central domain
MTFKIPAGILAQHAIVLGKTRSGKSSKMRVMVEQLLAQDKPVCIIDPKGDWWGIKSSADGKSAGFPLVIFGGEHADVPINEHSGAGVAELVATGNRSCLIDLGGWMVGERTRFFIAFASTLFKLSRGARHLVIDEVHNFAPQGRIMDPDAGKMLHWANRLASEGSGKGLTLIAASQRPQKVHKDFVTSCETLVACRVIHKLDRDAIKDWIDGCADPAKGREVLATLAGMQRPEAWVWSPEIDYGPVRLTFPMFSTYDSFKPQQADATKLKGWASVDLEEVKTKLAKVVEEAKANDPAVLKRRIAELERQMKLAPPAPAEISTALRQSYYAEGYDSAGNAIAAQINVVLNFADEVGANFLNQMRKLKELIEPLPGMKPRIVSIHPQGKPIAPAMERAIGEMVRVAAKRGNGHAVDLPQGEAAILRALIMYPEGLRREQLTVLTSYKRSTRDAYIQRLRERGFLGVNGIFIVATPEGMAAMPNAQPLPRGEELQAFWRAKLPDGERRILDQLIIFYPNACSREILSDSTGFKRSTRDAYLQRLAAKELVTESERGKVRAAEELFT